MRLPEGEARARFGTVSVVRPGSADGQGQLHVVVVTFAVDGHMMIRPWTSSRSRAGR